VGFVPNRYDRVTTCIPGNCPVYGQLRRTTDILVVAVTAQIDSRRHPAPEGRMGRKNAPYIAAPRSSVVLGEPFRVPWRPGRLRFGHVSRSVVQMVDGFELGWWRDLGRRCGGSSGCTSSPIRTCRARHRRSCATDFDDELTRFCNSRSQIPSRRCCRSLRRCPQTASQWLR
jgi:hypothetical protein